MSENSNQKACCFTGHRPHKLSWGYNEEDPKCLRLKEQLKNEIVSKIELGCTEFITGMAMGADIWCAEIVLELKRKYPGYSISLTAVVPYRNQPGSFPAEYMKRYANILREADKTVLIGEKYAPGCMRKRNRYMVDGADCMIAVSSGEPGGTKDTLGYAQKKGLDIVLFHPDSALRVHIPAQLHLFESLQT